MEVFQSDGGTFKGVHVRVLRSGDHESFNSRDCIGRILRNRPTGASREPVTG